MTTNRAIATTSSTDQNQEPGQEQETRARPLPDTGHYTEQTTSHEQQDPRTKRSRERSRAAHLCITIPRHAPASGRPGNRCHQSAHPDDLGPKSISIVSWSSGC
jgi:hypothetical protein